MYFLLLFVALLLLVLLPATWAIGHYLYFRFTRQVRDENPASDQLLDAPLAPAELKKGAWSFRVVLGRTLAAIFFGLIAICCLLLAVGTLRQLVRQI